MESLTDCNQEGESQHVLLIIVRYSTSSFNTCAANFGVYIKGETNADSLYSLDTCWLKQQAETVWFQGWFNLNLFTGVEMKGYRSTAKPILWIICGVIITHCYDWMSINFDPDLARHPIPESKMHYKFSKLNKYGNDSSGCPTLPSQFVRVSNTSPYNHLHRIHRIHG